MSAPPRRTVTRSDHHHLARLVAQHAGEPGVERLERALGEAEVLPAAQLPPDVVTMDSLVVLEDEESGARRQVTLCYPVEATGGPDRVSVLADEGLALLGARVGSRLAWGAAEGVRHLRVVAVPYQSEAAHHAAP